MPLSCDQRTRQRVGHKSKVLRWGLTMTTEEAIYEAPSRKIFITRESGQVGQLSFQLKDTSAVSLTDYIAITLGGLVLGSMLLIGSFSLMLISSFSHWIFWSAVVLCLLSIFILALFGWKGREMASLSICTGSQLDAKSYRHPSRGFSYSDLAHIAAAIESAKTDKPVGQCRRESHYIVRLGGSVVKERESPSRLRSA
jgi:hypothetical protein